MEEFSRYKNTRATKVILGTVLGLILVSVAIFYHSLFAAPTLRSPLERFVVAQNSPRSDLGDKLKSGGFIRSVYAFNYFLNKKQIQGGISAGTYTLSKSMNVWQVVSVFAGSPSEMWVTIPPGLRKEEIGEVLAGKLGWTEGDMKEWTTATVGDSSSYIEGVYSPDTYLIPRTDTPTIVAKRLRAHFEDTFSAYAKEAVAKNIKWPTVLKVASLIQREAGSKADMPIISGVIWNRLEKNMKLQIDATVQYARGNTGSGWWAPLSHGDLSIDSPYNTYMYTGLPPHPIANPSLDAIDAAINPATTTCLFYIHDSSRIIHCATTNEEQNANIQKYLQ